MGTISLKLEKSQLHKRLKFFVSVLNLSFFFNMKLKFCTTLLHLRYLQQIYYQ